MSNCFLLQRPPSILPSPGFVRAFVCVTRDGPKVTRGFPAGSGTLRPPAFTHLWGKNHPSWLGKLNPLREKPPGKGWWDVPNVPGGFGTGCGLSPGFMRPAEDLSPALVTSWGVWRE